MLYDLALFGDSALDHEALHSSFSEHGVPQVSDAEHEAQLSVPLADDGVFGEEQRGGALARPDHLRADDGPHVPVDDERGDALEGYQEDALGALLRDDAVAVADGRLRLDAVEEAAGEVVDAVHAGRPVDVVLVGGQVVLLEVAVDEEDEPPDDGEEEPGEHVRAAEGEQRPAPLGVDEQVEGVQEADDYGAVLGDDVVLAVLEDDALANVAQGTRFEAGAERNGGFFNWGRRWEEEKQS